MLSSNTYDAMEIFLCNIYVATIYVECCAIQFQKIFNEKYKNEIFEHDMCLCYVVELRWRCRHMIQEIFLLLILQQDFSVKFLSLKHDH